ncbi:hypothetical protein MXF21_17805 [Enterococcus casseliflavus]|uniref:hypothetical protein n=1 Tax=Enterococcus casseliflavus TaxID=37734 RepID=UPI002DBB356E|nr:hypothetical protein [Enterococcus casseliflavus]MEB6087969.1 hypothetical protein [Enterococcus casseliflavus]
MKRLKMSGFGLLLVLSSIFLLGGCSNSSQSKLADLFEEEQSYYLSNSPSDDPEFKIEKMKDGSLTVSNIVKGISETMEYSVEEKENGLYHYRIANSEDYGIFDVLDSFTSDTKDFNVFFDEKNNGYAFVPVSKNFSKIDSTLEEVKEIYDEDPQYFVAEYKQ